MKKSTHFDLKFVNILVLRCMIADTSERWVDELTATIFPTDSLYYVLLIPSLLPVLLSFHFLIWLGLLFADNKAMFYNLLTTLLFDIHARHNICSHLFYTVLSFFI